jgi:hypothetical protein
VLGEYSTIFAAQGGTAVPYNLIAVKGGESEVMFDQAMASLGSFY